MSSLPVVAVIATRGKDRLPLLLGRSLPSIGRQTRKIDLVLVVSDNDPMDDFLQEEDVQASLDAEHPTKARLVPNVRTRRKSGTGSWNTGVLHALKVFGERCWIAILDDDDEWTRDHIETCLGAVKEDTCQWVVSGIIRKSPNGTKKEPLMTHRPMARDFLDTNPGIQGSNMFITCGAFLKAGLFDESLSSTTDRDMCIRLCDVLKRDEFASTGSYTVIHYADADRVRVSSPGSPAKIQGLRTFYFKHAPRMDRSQKIRFKKRAEEIFGCGKDEFMAGSEAPAAKWLETWSGKENLPLHAGTLELLPRLTGNPDVKDKRRALFGIITNDMRRIVSLLDDLSGASISSECDFLPFVVVFTNTMEENLPELVENAMKERTLSGFVLKRSNPTVTSILHRLHGVDSSDLTHPGLSIALSRSVLQVFIFHIIGMLNDAAAVVIIDDDKRLPKGWSPFSTSGDDQTADIQIGRDLRTPPNPSLFSARINLVDLLYNLDLYHHQDGDDKDETRRFCMSQEYARSHIFDWYYDMSSSKWDHLEKPVYSNSLQATIAEESFFESTLVKMLLGTPICRDVIPCESGDTLQRGGCMIILNKRNTSFRPLALQQHAPKIILQDGKVAFSRRSDSFWCQTQKQRGQTIAVNSSLFVYHDNRFDSIPSPFTMRKHIVQEICGGMLCRKGKWRKEYIDNRVPEVRSWLSRVNGLIEALRNRPYCSKSMIKNLIIPLEQYLDPTKWENEVFSVLHQAFQTLNGFSPNPFDFSSSNEDLKIEEADAKIIRKEWNEDRIGRASAMLIQAVGLKGEFIGIGNEGVSFRLGRILYKVFDQYTQGSELPPENTIRLLGSSYAQLEDFPPIVMRPYYHGLLFRGGHGPAMIAMLREWKKNSLYHKNVTPDNILIEKKSGKLIVLDIGKDVQIETRPELYKEHFDDMCKRAYLCFRYGAYANNSHTLNTLKKWMRKTQSFGDLPGFETFMKLVYHPEEDLVTSLTQRMKELNAKCCAIISVKPRFESSSMKLIGSENDDTVVINEINKAIVDNVTNDQNCRIGIAIEDPFFQTEQGSSIRRPLWFYRRHLKRNALYPCFSIEEHDLDLVSQNTLEEYVGFHIFLLCFDSKKLIGGMTKPRNPGCFLMIKSCPMEHERILADVRRIVHSLKHVNFKSISIVADTSKKDSFVHQYASSDMDSYAVALQGIKEERLVDRVLSFDGQDVMCIRNLNKQWLGNDHEISTHSASKQQYASTFFAFKDIMGHAEYKEGDLVLQMDSDIILHCEKSVQGVLECSLEFDKENELVSFGFPIPGVPLSTRQYAGKNGMPPRFEIRCSFIHLGRLHRMLPLIVPEPEVSKDTNFCLNRGWWHTLDFNIHIKSMKSCRGTLGDDNEWFFIHPPNEFKNEPFKNYSLLLVSDIISSIPLSILNSARNKEWKNQVNNVNLKTMSFEWLSRHQEDVVVIFELLGATYGKVLQCFQSFMGMTRHTKIFKNCGVIVFDNGSKNCEDVNDKIFEKSISLFQDIRVSTVASKKRIPADLLKYFYKAMCASPSAIIFIVDASKKFDMCNTTCLLPTKNLLWCNECTSFHDKQKVCLCSDEI